jgi:hypothetical protein
MALADIFWGTWGRTVRGGVVMMMWFVVLFLTYELRHPN